MDFGPPEKLRICIYKDVTVSDAQAEEIIAALQKEFSNFALDIQVPWVKNWERPAYTADEIIDNFVACPLESPCDRLLALVGRSFSDFLWGIFMPEVHGAVDDLTMTKGFTVAEIGSFNQMLSFTSAADIAIHETYHLLGCDHGTDAKLCYEQIARIKRIATINRLNGRDFFPAMPLDQSVLTSREEVEKKLEPYQRLRLVTCEVKRRRK